MAIFTDHDRNFDSNESIAGHSTLECDHIHLTAIPKCMVNAILIHANTLFTHLRLCLFAASVQSTRLGLLGIETIITTEQTTSWWIVVGSGLIFGHNERMAYLFTTWATKLEPFLPHISGLLRTAQFPKLFSKCRFCATFHLAIQNYVTCAGDVMPRTRATK